MRVLNITDLKKGIDVVPGYVLNGDTKIPGIFIADVRVTELPNYGEWYKYETRHLDNDINVCGEINNSILVNFFGTFLTIEKIDESLLDKDITFYFVNYRITTKIARDAQSLYKIVLGYYLDFADNKTNEFKNQFILDTVRKQNKGKMQRLSTMWKESASDISMINIM